MYLGGKLAGSAGRWSTAPVTTTQKKNKNPQHTNKKPKNNLKKKEKKANMTQNLKQTTSNTLAGEYRLSASVDHNRRKELPFGQPK